MKKLIVVLQILVALVVLVGGAVIVKRYRQSHGKKIISTAYAPITAADEGVMAQVACSRPTGIDEKKSITCSVCPTGSDFAGEGSSTPGLTGWTVESVLQGHFTGGKADEALLHVGGCESHAKNFGGDFIMRRAAGEWSAVRYASGATATKDCQKLKWQGDRDAVICEITDMHQGVASDAVELLLFDAAQPPPYDFANSVFVELTDESSNCGFQQAHNGPEALMQFGKIDSAKVIDEADGTPYLSVAATIERVRSGPTKPGVCPTGHRRTYHIAFHNMGDHFEAGDGYAELAMQKRDDCCEMSINKTVHPGRY